MFEKQSWTLFQQNTRELRMCWRFGVLVAVETEQIKMKSLHCGEWFGLLAIWLFAVLELHFSFLRSVLYSSLFTIFGENLTSVLEEFEVERVLKWMFQAFELIKFCRITFTLLARKY